MTLSAIETMKVNSSEFMHKLEQIECSYWMKYYRGDAVFSTYASVIGDGVMCAIPEVDILAMNRVIGVGIKYPLEKAMIAHIIKFYQIAGSPRFFIQLPPTILDPETTRLLENSGFRCHNTWTKLYRSVEPVTVADHHDLEIDRIDSSMADLYGQLLFMSFDWEDSRIASWLASTVGTEGYQHYIVSKGGNAIAAGALYVEGEMASMAFAGTLESFRGMGAQKLLLETRLNDAHKLGAKIITAETATQTKDHEVVSYKNMVKAGFETAYHRQNWLFNF